MVEGATRFRLGTVVCAWAGRCTAGAGAAAAHGRQSTSSWPSTAFKFYHVWHTTPGCFSARRGGCLSVRAPVVAIGTGVTGSQEHPVKNMGYPESRVCRRNPYPQGRNALY